jgi:hypothetical protein
MLADLFDASLEYVSSGALPEMPICSLLAFITVFTVFLLFLLCPHSWLLPCTPLPLQTTLCF